jgi:hypothetical protein
MLWAFALSLIQIYIEFVTKFNLDEGENFKLFSEQSFVFVCFVKKIYSIWVKHSNTQN